MKELLKFLQVALWKHQIEFSAGKKAKWLLAMIRNRKKNKIGNLVRMRIPTCCVHSCSSHLKKLTLTRKNMDQKVGSMLREIASIGLERDCWQQIWWGPHRIISDMKQVNWESCRINTLFLFFFPLRTCFCWLWGTEHWTRFWFDAMHNFKKYSY